MLFFFSCGLGSVNNIRYPCPHSASPWLICSLSHIQRWPWWWTRTAPFLAPRCGAKVEYFLLTGLDPLNRWITDTELYKMQCKAWDIMRISSLIPSPTFSDLRFGDLNSHNTMYPNQYLWVMLLSGEILPLKRPRKIKTLGSNKMTPFVCWAQTPNLQDTEVCSSCSS